MGWPAGLLTDTALRVYWLLYSTPAIPVFVPPPLKDGQVVLLYFYARRRSTGHLALKERDYCHAIGEPYFRPRNRIPKVVVRLCLIHVAVHLEIEQERGDATLSMKRIHV